MPSATEPVPYFSFPAVLIILPLSIITQKIRNFSHSFFQNFNSWQIYHPEMIRLFPVKSTSLYDQDLLILQQIQCKFFIIYNVELLYIDLREHIKCSLRFDGSDSRNVSQCLVNIFALFVNTSARNEVVVDACPRERSERQTVPEHWSRDAYWKAS